MFNIFCVINMRGKSSINNCNMCFLSEFAGCLLKHCSLHAFEVCTIWDILCMHIINTCAA